MNYVQTKRANIVELLSGAFRELSGIARELVVYAVIFAVVTLSPIYDGAFGWVLMLLGMLLYFGAQYALYRGMLRNAGLLQDEGWRYIQFVAMAVMLAGLSVSAYKLLSDETASLTEVFS